MASGDTESFNPDDEVGHFKLLDILQQNVKSRPSAKTIAEDLDNHFIVIPRTADALEWLSDAGVARIVGTVCSHGVGSSRCAEETSPRHRQEPIYAKIDAPETSDYPLKAEDGTPIFEGTAHALPTWLIEGLSIAEP